VAEFEPDTTQRIEPEKRKRVVTADTAK